MFREMTAPDRQTFAKWTRDALRQLYDSPTLGAHPLAVLLAEKGTSALDRAQNLRRIVLESIHSLRPGPGIPADSPDWRVYRILELRYIDGLTPDEAMEILALQKSQFYRDQARALQALASRLWDCYQSLRPCPEDEPISEAGAEGESLMGAEAQRLVSQATWQEMDAGELLNDLYPLIRPLAEQKGIRTYLSTEIGVRIAHASRVPLRQAILNAVTYALDLGRDGELHLRTFVKNDHLGIAIEASCLHEGRYDQEGQESRLHLGEQLMQAMGGSLAVERPRAGQCVIRLWWPRTHSPLLLVIDDNRGFIELYRRYLAEHGWQVVGAASAAEAWQVIAETRPTVILLDVLMPHQDGWDLLIALKADEATRDIPIIVSSVLKEPQLALSLGATGHMPKPVSEADLLRALAPWEGVSATRGPKR
ncbi:MAG: response regulator [Chloroflexi bacterium]|nr:response regulator [Chloroflexota bacterium]